MDLNPYEFKAPWDEMEFSTFCKNNNVDAIIFLTNWLDNEPNDQSEDAVMHIINYWLNRLFPYLKQNKPVYFLAANRCGKERETTFIGCSAIIKACNKPSLISNLNKTEENTICSKLIL
jgi:protein N-terminal amidase